LREDYQMHILIVRAKEDFALPSLNEHSIKI